MPIRNYPFSTWGAINYLSPMLPLRIINPHTGKSIQTWGLIDTGASQCAIPAGLASILGHNLPLGSIIPVGTGNGVANAYAHTTRIEILALDGSSVLFTINDIPINFMPNLGPVLLGVDHFMEYFVLTVDYPKQQFSISKNP